MQSASVVAFRFRLLIHALVYTLGFLAPWDRLQTSPTSLSTWLVLAAQIARQGWLTFTGATVALLVLAIALTLTAAGLRTWATAWMGQAVVGGGFLEAKRLVVDGPYRRMRNPLYAGVVLHTLAVSMLMPPTGAVFAVVATALLDTWLARMEGVYLRGRLGATYEEYRRAVPAVLPALRAWGVPSGRTAAWGQAMLGELYFWGAAISFAALGWRYNALVIDQGLLVAFGCAMVVRALLPKQRPAV